MLISLLLIMQIVILTFVARRMVTWVIHSDFLYNRKKDSYKYFS